MFSIMNRHILMDIIWTEEHENINSIKKKKLSFFGIQFFLVVSELQCKVEGEGFEYVSKKTELKFTRWYKNTRIIY